jgi:hypothetical protein
MCGPIFSTSASNPCDMLHWNGRYFTVQKSCVRLADHPNSREVTCQSSALRKNRNRTETSSRMKTGPRLDGVVRSVDDDSREFCAIESARRLRGGTSSTKWLSDNAKLQKVLRDMLSRLVTLVDNDPQIVRRLQVVGISTAGLHLQVTRLCHRKGYVCLSTREQLFSVPDDVMQVKQLLLLLVAVVRTKVCIVRR